MGWVTEHFGARYAVGLGALACIGAGVWGLWSARRHHIDDVRDELDAGQMAEVVERVEDPPADTTLVPST